jgi:hypothetical protein
MAESPNNDGVQAFLQYEPRHLKTAGAKQNTPQWPKHKVHRETQITRTVLCNSGALLIELGVHPLEVLHVHGLKINTQRLLYLVENTEGIIPSLDNCGVPQRCHDVSSMLDCWASMDRLLVAVPLASGGQSPE